MRRLAAVAVWPVRHAQRAALVVLARPIGTGILAIVTAGTIIAAGAVITAGAIIATGAVIAARATAIPIAVRATRAVPITVGAARAIPVTAGTVTRGIPARGSTEIKLEHGGRTRRTAQFGQIAPGNPALDIPVLDIAPAGAAALNIDAIATAKRIDGEVIGAGTGTHIDIGGGDGGRGKCGSGHAYQHDAAQGSP